MRILALITVLMSFCLFQENILVASNLDLSSYLKEVREHNKDLISHKQTIESSSKTVEASSLSFSPVLFLNLSYDDDKTDSTLQSVGAEKLKKKTATAGISNSFRYGFDLSFSYTFMNMSYDKTLSDQIPQDIYVSTPSVTLKTSLWKNIGGSSVRAQEKLAQESSQAKILGEKYKIKMLEYEAELLYWGLSLARKMVDIQKENLSRAKKQLEWTEKRISRSLADPSDAVQVQALVQTYSLALKKAQEEVRNKSISFNTMRGSDSEAVTEKLSSFSKKILDGMKVPSQVQYRYDVQAALHALEATKLQAKISKDKLDPNLELSSSYTLMNKKDKGSDAFSDSFDTDTPHWNIALSFSTPLDFGIISRSKSGYNLEVSSAKESFDKKVADQKTEWQNYMKKLSFAKENLAYSTKLREIQKSNLDFEKNKYTNGKTTLFQVISYETEYDSALASELSSLYEVIKIYSYLNTYTE